MANQKDDRFNFELLREEGLDEWKKWLNKKSFIFFYHEDYGCSKGQHLVEIGEYKVWFDEDRNLREIEDLSLLTNLT